MSGAIALLAPVERDTWTLPGGKLSMSRARLFDACPRCFWEQYVMQRPQRVHIALPVGSAVHAGVQHVRAALLKAASLPTTDEVLDVTRDALTYELGRVERELLDADLTDDQAADQSVALVKAALTEILPREAEIGVAAVEVAIDYEDVFPFVFEAYADVILSDLTLKDLKTSKTIKAPDMFAEFQLGAYGLPWHRAGQQVQLQVDQIVKPSPRQPEPRVAAYPILADAGRFNAVEHWLLETADAISSCMERDHWPIRLSNYSHRFTHGGGGCV